MTAYPKSLLDLSLPQLFERAYESGDADRPFVFFEEETWSYRRTRDTAWGYAAQLRGTGVGQGDRVITVTANEPRTVALHLALAWLGATYVPVIPVSSAEELEHFVGNTAPRAAVVDPEAYLRAAPVLERHGVDTFVTTDGADVPGVPLLLTPRIEAPGDAAATNPRSELTIMYTSGSTGRPKGVILSHGSAVASGYTWGRRLEFGPDDVVLGVNPQFHVGGMKNSATAMACSGAYMMQRQFSRTRFWGDVRRAKATGGVLMPAMCSILLTDPPQPDDREHTLRSVVSHFVNEEFEDRFGVDIVTVWAMSETAGSSTLTAPGWKEKTPNLAGWALDESVELEIRDDDGNAVPAGVEGEIWSRCPWQFTGYLNDPEGTAATIVDGWIRSGDLGHLDDVGLLYYTGRKKNMIKRAGENVSALEVEEELRKHPDVSEAAVFGVPDPIRTEEVKAVVVLRPGAVATFADLVAHCEQGLSPFKVPRYWERRHEFPRTAVHKVDVQTLKREFPASPGWDRSAPA